MLDGFCDDNDNTAVDISARVSQQSSHDDEDQVVLSYELSNQSILAVEIMLELAMNTLHKTPISVSWNCVLERSTLRTCTLASNVQSSRAYFANVISQWLCLLRGEKVEITSVPCEVFISSVCLVLTQCSANPMNTFYLYYRTWKVLRQCMANVLHLPMTASVP